MRTLTILFVVIAGSVLAGCGGSTTEEDQFVAGCVTNNTMTEEICRCTAREAKSRLSSKSWRSLFLDMTKSKEAEEARRDLTRRERENLATSLTGIVSSCVSDTRKP